ncbi:methyltransferase domain-containing protein [Rathayibacter sp. AY1D9]|uniref:class I SAM-dependent methyltransferase n=1 Tax=Rathayibacter sp. AY1D9 TaxID=2080548 RepID=UPI0015E453F8|nr:methyltransferase domain-containing protein [Rathayibacter sp. AY1D9]
MTATSERTAWAWGSGLAERFDCHIDASVPLYREGHELILELSDWWAAPGASIVDVGCSTGTLTAALADRHPDVAVLGIDSEPEMLREAQSRGSRATFRHGDATDCDLGAPDLVVAHYVAQFLPPATRSRLLRNVFDALQPGGALVLFEKTLPRSPAAQSRAAQALHSHKLRAGIPADEVLAKDRALRGVLRPRTTEQLVDELASVGFEDVEPVMRWMHFAGFLAVKGDQ